MKTGSPVREGAASVMGVRRYRRRERVTVGRCILWYIVVEFVDVEIA